MSLRTWIRVAIFATTLAAVDAAAQAPLERARTLLSSGNATQAYAELAPLAREMAGMFDEVTAEVNAGIYTSAGDARAAADERLQALRAEGPATTRADPPKR